MWRQDIAEEKQAQPQMARGCLCLSINAKQTTSLGKEDISLFISLPSFLFFSFFFFRAYINFESRGEAERLHRARARNRERQTGLEKKGREGQMKSIFRTPETSGFIFGDPKGNCK